jgi:hypothetical protein
MEETEKTAALLGAEGERFLTAGGKKKKSDRKSHLKPKMIH